MTSSGQYPTTDYCWRITKAGLIISTRLVQSNGFDSTPDIIPYEHIDVRKLDSSRVSVFRWRVYHFDGQDPKRDNHHIW